MDSWVVLVQEDLQRKFDHQLERLVASEFLAGLSWMRSLS